jgi:hypothetical protein
MHWESERYCTHLVAGKVVCAVSNCKSNAGQELSTNMKQS